MASIATIFNFIIIWAFSYSIDSIVSIDYKKALTNSLQYYEAQRSGKLPANQRVAWRGHSALRDGQLAGVNLEGGYYDAGDNVKFGFPMAFTVTLLSWSVVEYGSQLAAKGELNHSLAAIKWGTDYFIKAHSRPNVLYAGVGDPEHDHECWERPEDMDTPRTVYQINQQRPGSDLAGETAAALAAASLAFRHVDLMYSYLLLKHAKQLFDFAKNHQGKYTDSIPEHMKYYNSSGFQDEQLWAAAWVHRASGDKKYKDFLGNSQGTGGTRSMFSWDDKFVGAQILAAKLVLEGKVPKTGNWAGYKDQAEQFLCNCMGKGDNNVVKTKGGLLWFDQWNNLQYTTSSSFALIVYADYLSRSRQALKCSRSSSLIKPSEIIALARSQVITIVSDDSHFQYHSMIQVDYILGSNPRGMSYMVGFGPNFPRHVHHRGASIVSIKKDPRHVECHDGYDKWCHNPQPNPNVLIGAIVGGPDRNDNFLDERTEYKCAEPATVTAAPLVGILARIG